MFPFAAGTGAVTMAVPGRDEGLRYFLGTLFHNLATQNHYSAPRSSSTYPTP
jgi:hypothetical protein